MIYWQPWRPETGQRVRTRISGECPKQYIWHGNAEEGSGLTGKVVGNADGQPEGHPFLVRLDDSPHYGFFAAIELEPLDG